MRKVTSDFKNQIERDNRNYYEWVDITLKDGTVLNLTNKNIWNSGIKIEDAVSDTSEFQIGTAIINKATVTLNNLYDDFAEYDFNEAKITIYIGYNIDSTILYRVLQDTTGKNILDSTGNEIVTLVNGSIIEKVKMFTGTVVDSPYQNSSLITLTCEDNMLLFDRDYSESKLIYPATRAQILRDACEMCGVSLETLTFGNSDYIVNTRPSDEKLTFRQVIAWTAQLGGQFLRCNSDGKLCCGWYDLKNYESDTVNEEYFDVISSNSSVTVNSEDVIITGIQVTAYQENQSEEEAADTSLYGKTGYVIAIADNKLIEKGTASTVAAMIGERVTGMRFRPFSASTLNNPTYEAGDICIIKDRKGVSYKSFLTSSTFQVGKYHTVQCGAKSAAKNSSKQYSVFSQAQVENRKNFQREKTEREKAVEEFNKALDSASGMFPTEVKQEDGSTILYVHDKKTLKDSKNVFKITSDAVGFSTDGGKTYPFGFTLDGDFLTRILYAIGINADYINTGAITVKDSDGNIIFQADIANKRVIISGDYVQIGGKTVSEKLNEVAESLKSVEKDLKTQIDGKIDTFSQASDPSVDWDTAEKKTAHTGDIWYDESKKLTKRWSGTAWSVLHDKEAEDAKKLAETKRRIFATTPVPPYDVNDLWSQGSDGDMMICKVAKASGEQYAESDWGKATKYTDDSAVDKLNKMLNQEEIFSRLTNGGDDQGIYILNGKVYINATYMQIGKISSKNGKVYFDLDNNELACSRLIDRTNENITINGVKYDNLKVELQSVTVDNVKTYGIMMAKEGHEDYGMVFTPGTSDDKVNKFTFNNALRICKTGNWLMNSAKITFDKFTKVSPNEEGDNGITINGSRYNGGTLSMAFDNVNLSGKSSGIYFTNQASDGSTTLEPVRISGKTRVQGNFAVSGTKSRCIDTENYGRKLQYCYEMASPYFGDIGSGILDDSGECYIDIDDIFSETVRQDLEYFVFLQKEGQGDIWVEEKQEVFFKVKGTPRLKFSWELKVRQKDYEMERLEDQTGYPTVGEIDYAEEGSYELENYIQNQEEITL